jgi:hypothetical protein
VVVTLLTTEVVRNVLLKQKEWGVLLMHGGGMI